jgi:hypothetical protein
MSSLNAKSAFHRRAAWLAAGLTVAYALLAFWNLGSTQVPRTWYTPSQAGEIFTIDMGGDVAPDRIYIYTGIGDGRYQVDISADGQTWSPLAEVKRQGPFIWSWSIVKLPQPDSGVPHGRWLRWTVTAPGEMLFEIAITQPGSMRPLPGLKTAPAGGPVAPAGELAKLVDEPRMFIYWPDTAHDMVFDEVYHARTAWEHLNRLEPYEWTHPPLGKIIIAAGIAVFGMDPFGWRLPAYFFGVAMLPLVYWIGLRLFKNPAWALAGQLLLALDFMHFTEGRLGLVDTFLVCFVLLMAGAYWRWFDLMRQGPAGGSAAPPREAYGWLLLSGLGLALGAATKWNALYPAFGLAVLFPVAVAGYWRAQGAARRSKAKSRSGRPGGRSELPKAPRGWLPLTLGVAAVAFVIIPAAVYAASYIPFFLVPGHQGGLAEVLDWQPKMYRYHADLNVPHDFASPWWQWPLLIKPLWAYTARDTMPAGFTGTVSAFGNPAIWWACFPALAVGAWLAITRRDRALAFLLMVLLSQYLPWIVAPRKVTFIYHFFPMVPVLCLLIVRILQTLWRERQTAGLPLKPLRVAYGVYFGLAIALFVAFYPVISGVTVPVDWVNALRWLPGWYF